MIIYSAFLRSALLIACFWIPACAPAGYKYEVGNFTPTPINPLVAQSGRQPAKAVGDTSPTSIAIKRYCAASTPMACATYTGAVVRCPGVAAAGYSILAYQRAMKRAGMTPSQAAEQSVRASSNTPMAPHPDDLIYLAKRAMDAPDVQPPETFRDALLKDCINAADR